MNLKDDLSKRAFASWLVQQSDRLPSRLLEHYLQQRGHNLRVRLPFLIYEDRVRLVLSPFPYQLAWTIQWMEPPIMPGFLLAELMTRRIVDAKSDLIFPYRAEK